MILLRLEWVARRDGGGVWSGSRRGKSERWLRGKAWLWGVCVCVCVCGGLVCFGSRKKREWNVRLMFRRV